MAHTFCPQCGYPLQGNETSCPECRCVLADGNNSGSGYYSNPLGLDEGDNDAEDILRKWLKWIKLIMIISAWVSGGFMLIYAILVATSYYFDWVLFLLLILGGALTVVFGYLFAQLIWAIGMIFINISTNVRAIKQRMR